jgi:uncharacterized protein (DUF1778 family)
MPRNRAPTRRRTAIREDRLGFRVDVETKDLIERAAWLERRKVSDFCVTALAETARRTIAEHETLMLTERDRREFFRTLINPREPGGGLAKAFAAHRRRVTSTV